MSDYQYQYQEWPKWLYGPDGEGKVFQSEEDVPEGWVDHPSKIGAAEAPKRGRPKKAAEDSTPIEDSIAETAEAPVEPSEF